LMEPGARQHENQGETQSVTGRIHPSRSPSPPSPLTHAHFVQLENPSVAGDRVNGGSRAWVQTL
jgi:hypothetical protein